MALSANASGAPIIGSQFAQAVAVQQLHNEAIGVEYSPLADLCYSSEESRLWRWANSSVDRDIENNVARFASLNGDERNAVRASLALDDFYTLLTFARRCALSSLRSGDASKIKSALSAMAMIELARIDWRDLLVTSRLVRHVGQRLRAPIADLLNRATQMAEPQTAEVLLRDRTTQIDLAESCGYRAVSTSEGVALFSTGYKRFSPKANLIEIAFAGAVALENHGYEISEVEVATDVPLTWLNSRDGSAIDRMAKKFSGCVSIRGVPRVDPEPGSSGQSLLVFLAEAASEKDAREVAFAAESSSIALRTQIGFASGQLCVVIIQWSWMADSPPLEDARSLERLRVEFDRLIT